MFRDLQNPRWIIAKGVLFLLAGVMASTLLLAEVGSLRTGRCMAWLCGASAGSTTLPSTSCSITSTRSSSSRDWRRCWCTCSGSQERRRADVLGGHYSGT